MEPLDPIEQLDLATGAAKVPEQQTESKGEQTRQTETVEPSGEQNELGTRGGIQFFFKVNTCKNIIIMEGKQELLLHAH